MGSGPIRGGAAAESTAARSIARTGSPGFPENGPQGGSQAGAGEAESHRFARLGGVAHADLSFTRGLRRRVRGRRRPIEGVGTAVAAFVGLASDGPYNQPTLVTNWNQYVQNFGDFLPGAYLSHAVYGYFMNGGGACFVVRIGANGSSGPAPARGELPAGPGNTVGPYRVLALEEGAGGNDINVEVVDAPEGSPEDAFKLTVKRGTKDAESFDAVSLKKGRTNVATVVNAQSKLIKLEETGVALERMPRGAVALSGGGAPAPVQLSPQDYVGDSAKRTGFGGLEAIDEVTRWRYPISCRPTRPAWSTWRACKPCSWP